jgi:hypothetical protein
VAELFVSPEEAGGRIAEALHAAAQALASPAAIVAPVPAGADAVSVAAAGRMSANAATLSAQLASGIPRIAAGVAAVSSALAGYETTDAAGAALISGHGAAGAGVANAALPAVEMPAVPVVEVGALPLDAVTALASLPGDPAVIDEALHAGAAEAGLHAHAQAWDSAAMQLHTAAQGLQSLRAGLGQSWAGDTAEGVAGRLDRFGAWMTASAASSQAHAQSARQAAQLYRTAVNSHPRADDVRSTEQTLLAAVRRAASGDLSAVGQAQAAEARLAQLKEQSVTAMTGYGQGVTGLAGVEHPGESPSLGEGGGPAGSKDGTSKDGSESADGEDGKAGDGTDGTEGGVEGDEFGDEMVDGEFGDDLFEAGDELAGLDPQSGPAGPGQLAGVGGQLKDQLMGPMMQMPTQLAGAAGQMFSAPAQQLGQATQMVSQLGQSLAGGSAGSVGRGLTGIGAGGGGGLGATDLGGGGLGGGGFGGFGGDMGGLGGGADFGGGTVPAGLPAQPAPPTPSPPPTTAGPVSVPRTSVPVAGGMAGGMPMGMMPMAGRGGGDGDKELPRDTEWFPDEALVKDEPVVAEAVAGQRRRPRPQET